MTKGRYRFIKPNLSEREKLQCKTFFVKFCA